MILLDEPTTLYRRREPSIKQVDWLFSLTGLFLIFVSLINLLFSPQKLLEFYYLGHLVVIPLYLLPLIVAILFFLLGGGYALLNRVFKIETDYKMGMVHLFLTLISVLVLLLKLMNAERIVHLSFHDILHSMLFFLILFLFAQFVFLTNAFMGFIKE